MRRALIGLLVAAIALTGFVAPVSAQDDTEDRGWRRPANVVDAIVKISGAPGTFDRNRYDYDLLREAVIAGGLLDTLATAEGVTVFAPNDVAFKRLARDLGWTGRGEADAFAFLAANVPADLLVQVLTYHVSPDRLGVFQVLFAGEVDTLNGATFRVRGLRLIDNDPDFRNPRLTLPLQITTANGSILHTINRVLIPADI